MQDEFENLNEVEQMLKRDDAEALEKEDIYMTSYMTEICAFFGANKCLEFMKSKNVQMSPLLNLYSIMQGNQLCVDAPHEDEMLIAVRFDRFERFEKVRQARKPPLSAALKCLLYALENWSPLCEHRPAYWRLVYELYAPEEWATVVNGEALCMFISYNKPMILQGLRLTQDDLLVVLDKDPNIELADHLLPLEITIDSGRLPNWRIQELREKIKVNVNEREEVEIDEDPDIIEIDEDSDG